MFRFAYPYIFLLILPAGAVFAAAFFLQRKKNRAMRVGSTRSFGTKHSIFYYKLLVPGLLFFAAAVLLIAALARPQIGNVNRDIRRKGIDIMLALDISGSMQLNDFKPNRLEASKEVAKNFVLDREQDRIGLVVFAGESFLQCPLTTDYDVVSNLIAAMEIAPQSLDGTAIGLAISNCINRLRDTESRSKVIILLTDGENNAGDIDPMTAASFAKEFGIRIYTIGMAGSGGVTQQGFFTQRIPPLNDRLLRAISDETDGRFYRADSDEQLKAVWDEISSLEKTEIDARQFMDWDERFFGYILAALIFFLAGYVLRNLIWRRSGC
ncbi:MAG: VWA domain-containing protein [Candidatus Marinimicrobia bacterium]|nr:VWA domain-containing protein [Candidatus Neomarinimicrobiota bacterium]